MIENVGRKFALIGALLLGSLALLLVPDRPFNMGLDLQGGTRLTYSLDIDAARPNLGTGETDDEIIQQTISIIRDRVDPTGVREALIRQEGGNRIVIELPRATGLTGQSAASTLEVALESGDGTITLDDATGSSFPKGGGVVRVGDEQIRYGARRGLVLEGVKRGFNRTTEVTHAAGAEVELVSDDTIRNLIENLGELSFQIVAQVGDFTGTGTDLTTEQQRVDDWHAANPGAPLVAFNAVPREDGGPLPGFAWYPTKPASEEQAAISEFDRKMPLIEPSTPEKTFRGEDLKRVFPSQDDLGRAAVGVEMESRRKGDFGEFTDEYEGRNMAIVLNNEIASYPTINDRLGASFIIRGEFTPEEINRLTTVLRSGSLLVKPTLEDEQVVGATLGEDYVRRGFYSGLLALGIVIAFISVYYRRLGLFAAVSLTASLLMLLGGLAFLQATLTLPGIAGIILTVGMAVDANILIFDRIREELDRGRNPKQAAKTGFEKAMSAILDANITTLLTALILYKVGTGPIRGFAVTLSIGIVTSVFSALVITRVLVHTALEKGTSKFTMGTWLVKAKYDFMGKTKLAFLASLVVIVSGVGLFVSMPQKDKFGIDFLGGGSVMFRTEQPETIARMREVIAGIPGEIGDSGEVKPVIDSDAGGGSYTAFRAVFKVTDGDSEDTGDVERSFRSTVRDALSDAGVLQKDKLEIRSLAAEGGVQTLDAVLYFEEEHPEADISARLSDAGIQSPTAVAVADRPGTYDIGGQATVGLGEAAIRTALDQTFSGAFDSNQREFRLAEAMPEVNIVGPQVVGDLKDKAILALAVSLFVVVLYIRVRFAEYSYGFAAVGALLHDVLVTLGALALVTKLGILNGEINLPMIAAFLTIIGYSLNDTIVIFDRVRENLPRMKGSLGDVLNVSINQTLSRTLLTSVTTLLAVGTLFAFNVGTGNVLESFSFAMIVGVVTGTYSTIFIANPILLALETRARKKRAEAKTEVAEVAKAEVVAKA